MATHSLPPKWPIRQVLGILYTSLEGRARIEGTGLEVFEVIRVWQEVEQQWEELKETFDWLSEEQLRAALAFYEVNRAFVDERLAREDDQRVYDLWEKYPQTKPPWN